MPAQVHISSPEDGDAVLAGFTATGVVRPKTHSVKLTLFCMQTGQSSVVTTANVDATTGAWTAGPFLQANGNQLSAGTGGTLTANSYNPQGVNADTDSVVNLTIQ